MSDPRPDPVAGAGAGRSPRRRWPPAGPPGRRIALALGVVLAVASAIGLFATDDPRWLRLAVLAAVWGLVVALLTVSRPSNAPPDAASPGTDLELRGKAELERERDVAARRERELRQQLRLRRDIEESLRGDLAALRIEIAAFRGDLAERWQGELRWERIALRAEATRLVGGDPRALADDVRRMEHQIAAVRGHPVGVGVGQPADRGRGRHYRPDDEDGAGAATGPGGREMGASGADDRPEPIGAGTATARTTPTTCWPGFSVADDGVASSTDRSSVGPGPRGTARGRPASHLDDQIRAFEGS